MTENTENVDRHFYLYAKNWYKKENTIEDLKKIAAYRCGLDITQVNTYDVLCILSNITERHINFSKFIRSIFDHMRYQPDNREKSIEEILIDAMLLSITLINVNEIPFELGKPDSSVLPLKN